MSTQQATRTTNSHSSVALGIGVAAIVVFIVGSILLALLPGNLVVIGVVTVLCYLLPVVGIVVGHNARRREGPQKASKFGLILSYIAFGLVVIPLLFDIVVRITQLA
ncbi:hypothetical protein [Cryobacterium sp. PH31-L1]|uniref:hypothetical protein n=1 Tax=Cryobacterium sp. PH31-L1 TaxID=3046199 RepID=UPI0024BAF0AE|nr:hypothetical protein [Cryobacterium sp. PH31-L1]MDJ0376429.1 hypothetical protein [Cryobacterium sp. PH31-L1]